MSFFDEMFADSETTRLCYRKYYSWLNSPEQKNIVKRKDEAENVFRRTGITFSVYSEKEETEKLIPFDLIPRILDDEEWRMIKKGVEQRVRVINSFLFDILTYLYLPYSWFVFLYATLTYHTHGVFSLCHTYLKAIIWECFTLCHNYLLTIPMEFTHLPFLLMSNPVCHTF